MGSRELGKRGSGDWVPNSPISRFPNPLISQPACDAAPFVTLDDVSIRLYDGVPFRHVQWQIQSDQHWAVVGPNGSGKSTLVKALCGQVPVIGGKIAYHFSDNGTAPQDQIAYVAFDSQQLVSGHRDLVHQARWHSAWAQDMLSVSDYLSEQYVKGLNPYQVVEKQADPAAFAAHREQVVEMLGIEALLDRNVFQVSNGERRKALLARALLKSPKLLILDNPFTGLDAEFRAKLKGIVSSLMQGAMRFLFVTNNREEILPDVTHVLVVGNEGIVAQGLKDVILDNIPHAFAGLWSGEKARTMVRAEHQKAKDGETAGPILVQMKGVNVAYNGVQVLEQVDWTVRQGENWALLGPNGAGKTTLLSLILGDNPQAYANDITLFGRRRGSGESIWDIKAHIGWVAPELHLYYPKHVPCFDVVCSGFFDSVGCYHRCSPQQCETASAWMQRLRVEQYANLAFGELSEGEQRLVLIARALVKEPELLVLDEPCQGLDARHRDRVLEAVEIIGNHLNTSVIYVTHHLDALPSIITHVLGLEAGKIKKDLTGPWEPRRVPKFYT